MNANLDLERRLSEFYASEASHRAPDRVLHDALATIDSTRQRRVLVRAPWRFPNMNIPARLALAAAIVIAVGAVGVGLAAFGNMSPVGVTVMSSPSAPAAPTGPIGPSESVPAATFVQSAPDFVPPFTYALPVTPHFDHGRSASRYFEVRVPEWYEAGHPGGLIIQSVVAGRTDRCAATSPREELGPGAQAVFDYLATVPELTITDQSATTVDGRPAIQARVLASAGTAACPDLHVWSEEGEPFITENELRLIAVDFDGEHVVITIYGEPGNPDWPALADRIVDSIRISMFWSPPSPAP